jgi:hypothetical protein
MLACFGKYASLERPTDMMKTPSEPFNPDFQQFDTMREEP